MDLFLHLSLRTMQNKNSVKSFLPFLLIFILSTAIIFLFKTLLTKWGFNITVLSIGNLILFVATTGSFVLYQKALRNNNVHVFMRMIYAGLFLKMFVCIIATLVYASIARSEVNKWAIFGCFGLYFVYTITEIKIIMRLSKEQKNA